MSQPNEQYAYFTITDSFDPGVITERVGVLPTEAWQKGDTHPRTRFERKFSRWSLYSRLPRTEPLEAHMSDVLAQLDERAEAFHSLSAEYRGCMQLVGYFYENYPGLHFERNLVEGLARYGLSVDFDFYHLWSDSREDT